MSDADVEAAFLAFYTSDRVMGFLGQWEKHEWLERRVPILREAVMNHLDGRYFSVICTLLPQIEGMLGDLIGEKPNPRNHASKMFRVSRLGGIAKNFYVKVIVEGSDWQRIAPIPELSRNAILHGSTTDYGTQKHSLQVLIIVDIIVSGIAERRAEQEALHGHEEVGEQD